MLELESREILFIMTLVLFVALSGYLAIVLWLKKTKGKSLSAQIQDLEKEILQKSEKLKQLDTKLSDAVKKFKYLLTLKKNESNLRAAVTQLTTKSEELSGQIEKMKAERDELNEQLLSIKEDISIFEPTQSLINVGFFEEPEYLFETSERFKEEIKHIREQQKKMIKEKICVEVPESIAITSESKYAKRILTGQTNLMIKAFNIECDKLMAAVKPSNYANILERIDKVATDIEKSALSLKCGFSKKYVNLKFKECELQYQFKLKQAREREEQAIIKEQIREEQKAIREFERALAKAQKEEEMYKAALDIARKELEIASDKDKQKLEDKIRKLQQQLAEAEKNEERAQSMAEQTRRGHVYIISNIGSFGEDIYKIGLTRRLEPLVRVKELGDASVPFSFDVHAMIYSEDAPNLERSLHSEFSKFRVNQVNLRKEFFNVNLLEIQKKAISLVDGDIDFRVTVLAEEYYESLKLRGNETEAQLD